MSQSNLYVDKFVIYLHNSALLNLIVHFYFQYIVPRVNQKSSLEHLVTLGIDRDKYKFKGSFDINGSIRRIQENQPPQTIVLRSVFIFKEISNKSIILYFTITLVFKAGLESKRTYQSSLICISLHIIVSKILSWVFRLIVFERVL